MKNLFVIVCCFCAVNSFAQRKPEKPVTVFTVNKKAVASDEFIYLYNKNHQNKQDEFTREKVEEYLDLFINFKLKVTEAQARGIDTTQAFLNEFNQYKEELRKPYLPDSKILDSLVKVTYNRMKEEVNASHILINVKPDALPGDTLVAYNKLLTLRDRAMKEENFEDLAQNNSEDPSAKYNKGNLGYFTALQMVYPFELAAFTTKPGEVSMPVRTRFGYHIIKVNDRRPSRGEVEVSHIMIRTGEDKDNEKSKNTIFDIYDQLQKGVSWNELCNQYSEDPATKANGGKLRPFGAGVMSAVPEFEKVAFELTEPGSYSDPFQTQYGWHIVKLERKIPLAPLEEMSASLKNRVGRDERIQISRQALYAKIKKDYGFKESTEVKASIMALADSTLLTGQWNPVLPDASSKNLFSLNGKSYSAADFIAYVKKNGGATTLQPQPYLEQRYNAFVEKELMNALEEKIMKESPDYRWLLKEYYEGILLFDIMEKEVWNKASEDSIGQKKYFDQHAASYKAGERVRASIYSSTTQSHLDSLKIAIGAKDSSQIKTIIGDYNIREEEGLFEKADRIILSKVDWAPGVYLAENNNMQYLVNISEIVPPGLKSFEEARPEVISDYQTFLEKEWIAALKKKFPVKINKKGKEFVISEIVANGK